MKRLGFRAAFTLASLAVAAAPALAAPEKVTVTGEMIDTWCYLSGVMGGAEAVVGTAHHACAMWCAIPARRGARSGGG